MHTVKLVKCGDLIIGDKKNIHVQSMLNIGADDIKGAVNQAKALEAAGCAIIRIAILDFNSIPLIYALKSNVKTPIVADIHFDYKLALESIASGIDKIRINPGNIGDSERISAVAKACAKAKIPIRIGVNSGSLEKEILHKHGAPTAQAMVESALYHAKLLNNFDFDDIVISIKSSSVKTMIEAYRLMASRTSYPLHLGVTEAGLKEMGIIKNAIGIGSLLADGIGDTIRVSLTADPIDEVEAGYRILSALNLKKKGCEIISCPTCGRCKIDLLALAEKVEAALRHSPKQLTVAVMGCAVNGPGEARQADIGVAGGDGEGLLFKNGKILKKVPYDMIFEELLLEISKM